MDNDESIFIRCQCGGCSVLEVNYDTFIDAKGQFYFTLWVQHPGTRPMSKKERIRWCKEVMKTGKPWADHTIVSQADAKRIARFILKKRRVQPKQNDKTKR